MHSRFSSSHRLLVQFVQFYLFLFLLDGLGFVGPDPGQGPNSIIFSQTQLGTLASNSPQRRGLQLHAPWPRDAAARIRIERALRRRHQQGGRALTARRNRETENETNREGRRRSSPHETVASHRNHGHRRGGASHTHPYVQDGICESTQPRRKTKTRDKNAKNKITIPYATQRIKTSAKCKTKGRFNLQTQNASKREQQR